MDVNLLWAIYAQRHLPSWGACCWRCPFRQVSSIALIHDLKRLQASPLPCQWARKDFTFGGCRMFTHPTLTRVWPRHSWIHTLGTYPSITIYIWKDVDHQIKSEKMLHVFYWPHVQILQLWRADAWEAPWIQRGHPPTAEAGIQLGLYCLLHVLLGLDKGTARSPAIL